MKDAPTPKAESGSAVVDDSSSPLCVLWVGDAVLAQRLVARRAPHVHILARDSHGALELLNQAAAPAGESPDILVFDLTTPGIDALALLEAADANGRDLPVLLLTAPGQNDVPPAGRLALCDRIVKTSEYIHQLLPSLAQARARHDLLTILGQTRESEERLRLILELQPAAVGVTDRQGKILAMNRAGLELLGLGGDGLGRDLTGLVPPEDRDQMLSMMAHVCPHDRADLDHALVTPDGTTCRVRTRGVPLRRDDGTVALLAIQPLESSPEPAAVADVAAEGDQPRHQVDEAITRESDRGQLEQQLEAARAERDAIAHERDTAREESHALASELAVARDHATALGTAQVQAQEKWDAEIRALQADHQAQLEALIAEQEAASRPVSSQTMHEQQYSEDLEQLTKAFADAELRAQTLADERDAQRAASVEAAAVSADALQASEARAQQLLEELTLARLSGQQSEQARAAAAQSSAVTRAKLDDVHRWLSAHQDDLTVLRRALQHLGDADLQCKALVSATAAWLDQPASPVDQNLPNL